MRIRHAGQGLDIAGDTDPGCVRVNNEDCFLIDQTLGLLVVADGMGGHNSGEVASSLAISTIREFARKMLGGEKIFLPENSDPRLSPRARQLRYFVNTANTMIYEKGRAFPNDAGMGTTVVAVLADASSMTIAHVGDSRLYLFRSGQLQQLTEDHSLVAEQVRKGAISAQDAAKSNFQNILTRALGVEKDVSVDVSDHPLFHGDILLLASDGLTKMVGDAELEQMLTREGSSSEIAARLIAAARAAGGVDNITVIAVRVSQESGLGALGGFVSRIFRG